MAPTPTETEGPDDAATAPIAVVREGGGGFERGPDGAWRAVADGWIVDGAADLTLGDLFQPDLAEVDGATVRLVPRAWASRRPDHPLAWAFEHADLGGRGPIPVPAAEWDERSRQVVAMSAPALHPWNLVGPDGVAALLGINEATVRAYLARRQMPEPLVRIGRTPVWSRHQIEAWHGTARRARPAVHTARPAPDADDALDDQIEDDDAVVGETVTEPGSRRREVDR